MSEVSPVVSVIIPMYNVAPYLRQCLDSVLSQSMKDFEAILIDDGSPDDSGKIADEYASKDSRIKVIHKENQGVSIARNDGIRAASGEYLFFLDSDDYLSSDALESFCSAAANHSVDVVVSDYVAFSERTCTEYEIANKEFVARDRSIIDCLQLSVFNMGPALIEFDDIAVLRGLGAAWHFLIKRKLVTDNNLSFDPSLALFDDGMFVLNMLEHANSVAYTKCSTYYYRHVSNSITRSFKVDPFDRYIDVYQAIEKYIADNDKDEAFEAGLALRKLIYLNKSMETYFFNPNNPASEKDRYTEFINLVSSPIYSEAFEKINKKHLGCKKTLVLLTVLRLHMYKVYWMIKKRVLKG